MANILSIDGVDYDVDKMSDKAKTLILDIRATDGEIARAQALTSMLQTARKAYARALQAEIANVKPEGKAN